MDAVELPLPADVVVSKILAKNGFARSVVNIEEPAMRFRVAGDSSGFGGLSVAGTSSPSGGRTKFPSRCSTSKLVSRIGKNNDAHVRGSEITSSCEVNEQHPCKETNNVIPSASEALMKKVHRKADKLPSSSPAVKKPRTGGTEDSPCPAGVDVKTGTVKLKHGIHSQRGEKRSFRMLARARNDAWCVKMGMSGASAMAGGSNILGIYGLKSGFHDITRYMDDLSINDLLDNDQRYHTSRCKGKRGTDGNHNITLAVRRACSLLPISSGAYSALADDATKNSEKHETSCQSIKGISLSKRTSTNSESERKEEMPSAKKDSRDHSGVLETLATDVPPYHPKDILEQLALPRAWSLDSLLSQASTSKHLAASKSHNHFAFPSCSSTCPPPFPWSLFPVGSSKPNNDSSKVSTSKNVPLHKWVRTDSWNGHIRNAHSHSLNQDSIIDADRVIIKKLEIDRNKDDILSSMLHCSFSSALTMPSVKSLCSPSEVDPQRGDLDSELKPFAELHSEKFVNHIQDVEGSQKHESSEELCSVEEKRSSSVVRNLVIETENPSERTCEYGDNNSWLLSNPSVSRCDLRLKDSTPSGNSTVGKMLVEHSPRLLAAARILYEISSCRDAMRKQSGIYGNIRWSCKPSQKVMKAPRTKASQVGKETSIPTVGSVKKIDPVKDLDNISLMKPEVSTVERKNSSPVASVQKETIKWSTPSSSRRPSQLTPLSIKKSRQRKLGTP